MLQNIKSVFFIKIIFSFVDEERKLKMLKYNKALQNKIGINLLNYQMFKGNYIIYETDRLGKEYDFYGTLLYEGEYLNGKRNGKGKEYCENVLIFEGEYLNGKINGKAKFYDFFGRDLNLKVTF